MKKSYLEIEKELKLVKKFRTSLNELFGNFPTINVSIGGSYALKAQLGQFHERQISDYDFIIHYYKEDDRYKAMRIIRALCEMRLLVPCASGSKDYDDNSWYFTNLELDGKRINLLMASETSSSVGCWEEPENILKVKRQYIEEAIKKNKIPREKDINDIRILEDVIELPF